MSKVIEFPPRRDASQCVAPELGSQLGDYHKGQLAGEKELEFEAHLLTCAPCAQRVAALDWLEETFHEEAVQTPRCELSDVDAAGAQALRPASSYAHVSVVVPQNSGVGVTPGVREMRSPALYIVGGLGGLALLGFFTFGIVKRVRHSRQRHALTAREMV